MGLYGEDPVLAPNFGYPQSTSKSTFESVLDRLIDYLKRTHQNMVIYPVVWYNAALYRDSVEYSPIKYIRAMQTRFHPPRFHRMMARRFSQEGVDFLPMIRNWRLPSIEPWVKNPKEILSGVASEYINTVTATGEVLTPSNHHEPPMLNCIHPRVKRAFKVLLAEIMDQIGQEPSVKGIALFTTIHSSYGFGTLDVSYDDYTMHLFSKETGINLPIPDGPVQDRFKKWYKWLRSKWWNRWIAWRKEKQT